MFPIPTRAGRVAGRALRAGLTALSALLLSTCTDNPIASGGGMGQIRVYPTFDVNARLAPLVIDSVWVTVVRPPNDTIKTVKQAFPANQNQIQVQANQIELNSPTEDLLVIIELRSGSIVLFSGSLTVQVTAGVTPTTTAIPVVYAGPGSNLDSLDLAPRDTTVPLNAVVPYRLSGFDAAGLPVAQFYASWSATAGTINAVGTFTAPAVPGTYLVRALSPNGVGDSTTIIVTAGTGRVWTGAVNNDWHTAGNWNPAQVPGLTENATIPAGPANLPQVSITANMNDLTIAAGATVTLAGSFTFNVAGNLAANGGLVVSSGTPTIQLSGAAKTLAGNVANATITGTVALAGNTSVSGNVAVSGGTASLDIGIGAMQVGGGFSTGSGGRLVMTTGGGQLNIQGSAAFGGRDETGFLTAGTITIGGNFSQTGSGSATSFAPTGTHLTGFVGASATHTVNFGTPGAGAAGSHFMSLDIGATGTVSLATDVNVDGQLISAPATTPPTLGTTGVTHKLTTQGVTVTALAVNQATITIGAGAIVSFNSVQFTNSPTTVAQLTVSNAGAATPFTFTSLSFATTPVAPNGFYMDVTDTDGATSGVLTINMLNANPASPGVFSRTAGGAVLNWPPLAPILTWDGSASINWSDLNNWTPAQVPTNADDVLIPSGPTNMPQLTTSGSAKTLTVNVGATLNLGAINFGAAGNVFADGAITGTGAVQISTTAQIRGNFPALQLSAPVSAVGAVATTGNIIVTGGAGTFTVGGQIVTIGTTLQVQSGALLIMTNPLDLVTVVGNASFAGGNELGQMSAGTLNIGGNLTQVGTAGASPDSYHPSGTHQTVFTGASPTINFGTPGDVPGSSHFQSLAWGGTGTLTLGSNVFAHGVFTTTATSAVTVSSASGLSLQVGSHSGGGPVTFNNVRLILDGPSGGPLTLNNATFSGLATTATQLTVSHPGVGGPFTFNNLTFSVTPTTGFYLSATDNNTGDGTQLVINVTNSSPPSGGSFVQVTNAVVNWPPAAPGITWNGSADNNWFNTANWDGGVVPTATDNVLIPAGAPTYPDAPNIAMQDLTVAAGATLTTADHTITVGGSLDASGVIAGCCTVSTTGTGVTARGNLDGYNLSVPAGAAVSLSGALSLAGAFNGRVDVGGGELIVNGRTLQANEIQTFSGGLLTMTNPADAVTVTSATFGGGDETGRLTAGQIQTQNLTQGGAATSFFAGGNHKVKLAGPSSSTVTFANPGTSRFQELDVSGVSAALTIGSNVTVAGQLISVPISANGPTINTSAPGSVLTAGGADVGALSGFTALTMDGVPLVLSGGTISGFSRVTFQNQNPNGTHLTVNNVGQGSPFTFSNLNFTTGLSAGGFYIQANDLDGPTANGPLTIDVIGASPVSGAGVSQANNGAVINWPPIGGNFTWDGSADNNWSNPANWDLNVVPGVIDNVILVPITNQPVLTTNVGINNLTSTTGSILDLNGFVLAVSGSVDLAGSITGTGTAGVTLTGTGQLLRGTINAELAVVGSYALNGNLITNANLSVQGSFDVGAFTAQVGGSFATFNTGVLVMQGSGTLDVAGDAIFTGGSTSGLLTSGVIRVGLDFSQLGTISTSFASTGTTVIFDGAGTQNVAFQTPGPTASRFLHVGIENTFPGGGLTLNTDVYVMGLIAIDPAVPRTLHGNGGTLHLANLNITDAAGTTFDNVLLDFDVGLGGTFSGLSNVTFQNYSTSATVLSFRHPGSALGPTSLANVSFLTTIGAGTGFYVSATDSDGTGPLLNLQVTSNGQPGPTEGNAHVQTSGGATVNFQN